jgi:S-formylglutathione hydrolase
VGVGLEKYEIGTALVPSPVACSVLTPEGGLPAGEAVPLVVALHGGAGGDGLPGQLAELFGRLWARGTIKPCVVFVPESGRSFWIDRADGSERWETFLVEELLPWAATTVRACAGGKVGLLGVSMGGMGVLRLAFHAPERYAAVAALEPGIEAAMSWSEVNPDATGVRSLELFEQFHGHPIDEDHFARNHPPALIEAHHARLAASGLQIYVECGDEDMLNLHHGAELTHRLLWDHGVPHEYHLVRGADHIGATLGPRFAEAIEFLGRAFDPPPPDEQVEALRALLDGTA